MKDDRGRVYLPTPLGPLYGVKNWIPSKGAEEGAMFGVDRTYSFELRGDWPKPVPRWRRAVARWLLRLAQRFDRGVT